MMEYPTEHWANNSDPAAALATYLAIKRRIFNRVKDDLILSLLPQDMKGLAVLDYGCGCGLFSVACAKRGARVTGIDASEHAIKAAQLYAIQEGASACCNFIVGTKLPQLGFDVVLAKDVIEHIQDDASMVRAVADVLKPKGQCVFATQTAWSLNYVIEGSYQRLYQRNRSWMGWDPTHVRFYSPASLKRIMRSNGLIVERWTSMYIIPYNIVSWFFLMKVNVTLNSLCYIDHSLGKVFPFNRLGWSIIASCRKTPPTLASFSHLSRSKGKKMSRLNKRTEDASSLSSDTVQRYRSVIDYIGENRPDKLNNLSELALERIESTCAMIPTNVNTILDVGCGDGRIIDWMDKRFKTVGVDYSYNSLRHLTKNAVCTSSENLPFRDKSFDLVLSCEVLEHLPDKMFKTTLKEIARVSRQYILISVPYNENLRLGNTKCPKCGTVFHIWGHVRRFSNRDLDWLFADFTVTWTRYLGRRQPYHIGIILYLNQRFGNRWAEFAITSMCPNCGNTTFTRTPRNPITIACGMINLFTSKLIPVSQKFWVLKLYARRQ